MIQDFWVGSLMVSSLLIMPESYGHTEPQFYRTLVLILIDLFTYIPICTQS